MLIFIDPLRVNLLVFHFTLKNLSDYLLAARMFYNANEVIVKLKKKLHLLYTDLWCCLGSLESGG